MSRDHNFPMSYPTSAFLSKEVYETSRAKLPWVLRKRPSNTHLASTESPTANPIRVASSPQELLEHGDGHTRFLSIDEPPSISEPNSPLQDQSPSNSERSSTPTTITPLTFKMAEDAAMTKDIELTRATGMKINAGIDGDDEKSPTFGRSIQISRKVFGSGNSKEPSKKDTLQTHERCSGGGDSTLRSFFRKKDGKAKDLISRLAKSKTAEQDDADIDSANLKVRWPKFHDLSFF